MGNVLEIGILGTGNIAVCNMAAIDAICRKAGLEVRCAGHAGVR